MSTHSRGDVFPFDTAALVPAPEVAFSSSNFPHTCEIAPKRLSATAGHIGPIIVLTASTAAVTILGPALRAAPRVITAL